MGYIPKSKLQVKQTPGDEFVYLETLKPYVGFYVELSDGTYYAGKNSRNLGEEIIKPQITPRSFGNSTDFKKYQIIKKSPYRFLSKTKTLPQAKNIPTEKDYEKGQYIRYFAKRVNESLSYIEIDKDTYNSISKKRSEYDYNLYNVGSIKWDLINTPKANRAALQITETKFPNISLLFPLLGEFQRIVRTNLITEGDEYYLKDGTEYIGPYHVHPTKGPMTGAQHISDPHPRLFELNQLPQNIKDKIKMNKITGTAQYILSGKSPDWLESTQEKAEESGRTLEQQALREATYVVDQSNQFSSGENTTTSYGSSGTSGGSGGGTSSGGGGGY